MALRNNVDYFSCFFKLEDGREGGITRYLGSDTWEIWLTTGPKVQITSEQLAAADVTSAVKLVVPMRVTYRNWKGVTKERAIQPINRPYYGHNEWHKDDQWLMDVIDEEGNVRTFACKDIVPATEGSK